ncbi:hypothetical protein LTR66_017339 [Elasticomyces elasticus]|nr:hypothetical protein LTR66_017339 [Elasticomyces elasticus]
MSPADIVDGFQEKTIRLMWAILSHAGITSMLDKCDLEQELRRLQAYTPTVKCVETVDVLKHWTHAIAANAGLEVNNFTTAFVDGHVFSAILDAYEPYLGCTSGPLKHEQLHARLARLGCVAPSRKVRNAITIQRAWRSYWATVQIERRLVKRDLANAAASLACLKHDTSDRAPAVKTEDHDSANDSSTEIDADVWLSL